jgi:hypothetical protein
MQLLITLRQSPLIRKETAPLSGNEFRSSGPSLLGMVRKYANACINILPKIISFVTTKVVEQQLKMLEVKN